MRILFINAQSLNTAQKDIVNIVNSYTVDIVCVNETWQDVNTKLKFLNWRVFDEPRKDRKGGGVAIMVNSDTCKFAVKELTEFKTTEYESVGIHVNTDKGVKFNLVCPYIPPEKPEQTEALCRNICKSQLKEPLIIMGDLNTKSLEWNNTSSNKSGEIVEHFISTNNMVCVNDGQPTRRNSNSVIDLILMSSPFKKTLEICDTLTHENIKSDHIGILLQIDVCSKDNKDTTKTIFQLNKVNWNNWKENQ